MRSYRLNAIVIKRRNFLEKDRILTLFSLERGKTEALAKGARRPGNRLSANSDLSTAASFHIHKAKSLDIILEIEPFFNSDGIRGQFDKTQKVSYAFKIIDKLFEFEEPYPNTYQSLLHLIKSVSKFSRQLVFMKFLIDVLSNLGSLPNLVNCPSCHKSISRKDEFVFAFQGGLTHKHCLDGNCLEIRESEIKLLRLLAKLSVEEIEGLKVESDVFRQSYFIIQKYFEHEFGKILPDEVM